MTSAAPSSFNRSKCDRTSARCCRTRPIHFSHRSGIHGIGLLSMDSSVSFSLSNSTGHSTDDRSSVPRKTCAPEIPAGTQRGRAGLPITGYRNTKGDFTARRSRTFGRPPERRRGRGRRGACAYRHCAPAGVVCILHLPKRRRTPCANITTRTSAFESTSKRRKGYPSETRVKRGVRIVHGDKELIEKLGRNDPCPCGSGRRFQEVLHAVRPV